LQARPEEAAMRGLQLPIASERNESIQPPNRAIDWPAIERDYRSGHLSLRALGRKFACAHSTIANFAARHGWARNGHVPVEVSEIVSASERSEDPTNIRTS
jgi:hypothetical protein